MLLRKAVAILLRKDIQIVVCVIELTSYNRVKTCFMHFKFCKVIFLQLPYSGIPARIKDLKELQKKIAKNCSAKHFLLKIPIARGLQKSVFRFPNETVSRCLYLGFFT
jgi:hypothetical protein